MPRTRQLRHVAVALTVALFAALLAVAGSTGHGTHPGRLAVGSQHQGHHASVVAPAPSHDEHGTGHLDLAVLPGHDAAAAPTAAVDDRAATVVAALPRTTRTTDSRGPPTA